MLGRPLVVNGVRVVGEQPTGAKDGVNKAFTLAAIPLTGTLAVYINGLLQEQGSGKDYTISGDTITMEIAPISDDLIICEYNY